MVKYKLIIASTGLLSTAFLSGCADEEAKTPTEKEVAKITEECEAFSYDKQEDSYECVDKESGHSGMFLFMGSPFSSRADMYNSKQYKDVAKVKGQTLGKPNGKTTGKVVGGTNTGSKVSGAKATAVKSNSAFKTGLGTSGAKGGG